MLKTAHGGEAAIHADLEEAAYTKVTLRLIPFLLQARVDGKEH